MIDSRIKAVQTILGVEPDGMWGPKSQAALNDLVHQRHTRHSVVASSFADAADVLLYQKAIALGMSEHEALAHGDNGVGFWDEPTIEGSGPSCALPPEDIEGKWGTVDAGKNKPIRVSNVLHEVICLLKDKMPPKAHIKTRARIDLNPDACAALGLHPPIMAAVVWEWV